MKFLNFKSFKIIKYLFVTIITCVKVVTNRVKRREV